MSQVARFDDVIHAPVRLRICGLLATARSMEFALIRDQLGVADSVLSKHVARLVAAGYVSISKRTTDGRVRTWLTITPAGRRAFAGHIAALQLIAAPTGGIGEAATHSSRHRSEG